MGWVFHFHFLDVCVGAAGLELRAALLQSTGHNDIALTSHAYVRTLARLRVKFFLHPSAPAVFPTEHSDRGSSYRYASFNIDFTLITTLELPLTS
ncbi:hypothetical protein C8J57DRAFT_131026 [Mycena rebaudengoi]|nr:hypothetical protein C8J57DRAFT_131026 [Mycena rebaudengoi]